MAALGSLIPKGFLMWTYIERYGLQGANTIRAQGWSKGVYSTPHDISFGHVVSATFRIF